MNAKLRLLLGFACVFAFTTSVQPSHVGPNLAPQLTPPSSVELRPEPHPTTCAGCGPFFLNKSGEFHDVMGHIGADVRDPYDDRTPLFDPPDGPPPGIYRTSIVLDPADPQAMSHLLELKRRSERTKKRAILYYSYCPTPLSESDQGQRTTPKANR
jgi:hypothetical protein